VITDPLLMGPDPVATVRALVEGQRGESASTRSTAGDALDPLGDSPDEVGPFGKPGAPERLLPSSRWMLQWRDKVSSTRETYARLLALGPLPGVPIVVNDRVDLALALGHGVHLTEGSLPTRIARSLLPANSLLGRSTHDLRSAVRAEAEGADYVVFGPVFDTPSKRPYGAPLGLDALTETAGRLRIPVFAIGGIGPGEIPSCLGAGAHGVALIRAVWSAAAPADALEEILGALAGGPGKQQPS
jgi:thiamine-phosphate pyrophosphorylase